MALTLFDPEPGVPRSSLFPPRKTEENKGNNIGGGGEGSETIIAIMIMRLIITKMMKDTHLEFS